MFTKMNQQAIATIILRILGLSYFYSSISAFLSGGMAMQIMGLNEAYGEGQFSIMAVVMSMLGVYFLFGLVLMIFAKPLSRLLFRANEKVNEETTLTANTLIEAAVPLVGLYFLISYFPGFVTTAVEWYKEKAGPTTGMPPQYGIAMASSTIMIVVALFITLRSRTVVRFLTRNAK